MDENRFLTRPLSLWLDAIRAVAAVAVMFGHAVQLGLYTGPWPFSIALQQNAVIVFFVLSGLVIAHSTGRSGTGAADYALARATRLLPVAWPGLLLALFAAWLATRAGVSIAEAGEPAAAPDWNAPIFAALFLSESWRTGLAIDPPYWSLCYEVWFYALFGAGHFLRGGKRLAVLAAMALVAGPNVLLLLPAWLLGVVLERRGGRGEMTDGQAWLRVTLAICALFTVQHLAEPLSALLRSVMWWNLGYSHYALSYLLLALAFAIGLTGLRHLAALGPALLEPMARPIRYAANMSFSLYLLHWPLIVLLRVAGISAGENPVTFAVLAAMVFALSAGFAAVTEGQRHALRAWLVTAFARSKPHPA